MAFKKGTSDKHRDFLVQQFYRYTDWQVCGLIATWVIAVAVVREIYDNCSQLVQRHSFPFFPV